MTFTDLDLACAEWFHASNDPVAGMYILFLILLDHDEDCLCHVGWRHCPVHQDGGE